MERFFSLFFFFPIKEEEFSKLKSRMETREVTMCDYILVVWLFFFFFFRFDNLKPQFREGWQISGKHPHFQDLAFFWRTCWERQTPEVVGNELPCTCTLFESSANILYILDLFQLCLHFTFFWVFFLFYFFCSESFDDDSLGAVHVQLVCI